MVRNEHNLQCHTHTHTHTHTICWLRVLLYQLGTGNDVYTKAQSLSYTPHSQPAFTPFTRPLRTVYAQFTHSLRTVYPPQATYT
jgi:hypothetical protein